MTDDPPSQRTILLVCFGNLCRSPMAEGLLRAALPRDQWRVTSAGTHAIGGDPPTRGARDAVQKVAGIDISDQRSAPLTVDQLRAADFVFTMSRRQALEAAALYPGAVGNIRLLGGFAPADDDTGGTTEPGGGPPEASEIADPIGGDADTYIACCKRIDAAVRAAARWLLNGAEPADAPPPAARWPELR